MSDTLVVVGDALLDSDVVGSADRLCPDAPVPVVDELEERLRPGGAGLAAVLAARTGRPVTLVSAFGDDATGGRLRALLAAAGVRVIALEATGTTRRKRRVRVNGQSLVRLDRGDCRPVGLGAGPVAEALADAAAVLVADYGGGTTALEPLRRLLRRTTADRPLVWDPHPRGAPAVSHATLLTPNEAEVRLLAAAAPGPTSGGDRIPAAVRAAETLRQGWSVGAVAVTLGAAGAVVTLGPGSPVMVPAAPVTGDGDTCGAGDCFSVHATAALAGGAVVSEAVSVGVAAAGAFVAGGSAGAAHRWSTSPGREGVDPTPSVAAARDSGDSAAALARAVRAAGGTVVVAGGCFDLLHRGHVELLTAARRLGDCLVVALNSDASVRMLKGPDRPVLPEDERAAILRAMAAVDDVLVFDETSPAQALEVLRPHLFVKGGDYAGLTVAEQGTLAAWGGQVVTLPYRAGRSTTRIVEGLRRG